MPRRLASMALAAALHLHAATLGPGESIQRDLPAATITYYNLDLFTHGLRATVTVQSGGATIVQRTFTAADLSPLSMCWMSTGSPQQVLLKSLEETDSVEYDLRIATVSPNFRHPITARGCAAYEDALRTTQPAARVTALQSAIRYFDEAGDELRQARTLTDLGAALWDAGKRADSLAAHEKAVALWSKHPYPRLLGFAQYRLAVGYLLLNQIPRGKELLLATAALARDNNAPWLEAAANTDLAMQISREGQYPEAIALLESAIAQKAAYRDRQGESDSRNILAIVEQNAGKLDRALDEYNLSLALRRRVHDEIGEAQCLNNIATVRGQLGQPLQAIAALEEVLAIRKRVATPAAVANTQHNLGAQRSAIGEYDEAIQLFDAALATWRAEKFPLGEASTLGELAKVYARLGMDDRAEREQRQALAIHRQIKNRRGEAGALQSLAYLLRQRNQLPEAERLYLSALAIAREATLPQEQSRALQGLGSTHSAMGRHDQAISELRECVDLTGTVNREDLPSALNTLAAALAAASRNDEAIALLRTIPAQAQSIENRVEEALARATLARLLLQAGQPSDAKAEIIAAIDLLEDQRAQVASPDLRAQFLSRKRDIYRLGTEILMKLGDSVAALELAERGRGRALLDLLTASKVAGSADSALLEKDRELRLNVSAKAARLTRLLSGDAKGPAAPLRQEITLLLDEHARLRERIAREDPRFDQQTSTAPSTEVQARLAPHEAMLVYSLGSGANFGWLVTHTNITGVALPPHDLLHRPLGQLQAALDAPLATRPKETLAQARARIAASEARAATAARKLDRFIVRPLLAQHHYRKLYIVADGELQSAPFAALPSLRASSIVMLPSASILPRLATPPKPPVKVAVFADPVFEKSDARFDTPLPEPTVSISGPPDVRFSRLRFSAREATAIAAITRPATRLLFTGFDASRAAALNARLSQFGILHFATHAILDERQPELSGIVLSLYDRQRRPLNGTLRLNDIAQMRLASPLVVLSACETAIGKSLDGEGMIGLSRAFLAAGASGVIATLWQVDDSATAYLVRAFYNGILRRGLTPAAALHAAQQAVRAQTKWSHPYYWAGFVYTGT
ncbi:MAG: CHAT domain-containing tetratricopeptide repeat protein [Acidobacteriota bacterium]